MYDLKHTQLYIRHYFLEEPLEPWIEQNQAVSSWIAMTGRFSCVIEGEAKGCHGEPLLIMAKGWRIGPFNLAWDSWIYGFIQKKPYYKFRVPYIGLRFWNGWEFVATRTFNMTPTKSGKRKWGLMVQYYKGEKHPAGTAQRKRLFKSDCFSKIKPAAKRTKTINDYH